MSGSGPWWLCPNEPRCGHARVFHDTEDDEDTTPRCCAEGCDCGREAAERRLASLDGEERA